MLTPILAHIPSASRSTPPCPDGGKPKTCADGSTPTGGRGGRGRCAKEEKICCDGSTPTFDGDRSTPPCADGSKPKCSQDDCWLFYQGLCNKKLRFLRFSASEHEDSYFRNFEVLIQRSLKLRFLIAHPSNHNIWHYIWFYSFWQYYWK